MAILLNRDTRAIIQGMTGKEIDFIARAAAPMFLIMLLFVVVLSIFPEIATFLPSIAR